LAEDVLKLQQLVSHLSIGIFKLFPFGVVFIDLTLAPLHHSIQIEDTMLHRGKSLILQLPCLHQLFPLFFVLLNIQLEFFLSPFMLLY
jgi:hypothetical protein